MGTFKKTVYGAPKNILMYDHSVAVNVVVSDEGLTVDEDGKKIVKAGTIVGGNTKSVLENRSEPVVKKNVQGTDADKAEGIILYDIDVTRGPETGAMIIHGFINIDNLPELPAEDAKTALRNITFIKTAKEVV